MSKRMDWGDAAADGEQLDEFMGREVTAAGKQWTPAVKEKLLAEWSNQLNIYLKGRTPSINNADPEIMYSGAIQSRGKRLRNDRREERIGIDIALKKLKAAVGMI